MSIYISNLYLIIFLPIARTRLENLSVTNFHTFPRKFIKNHVSFHLHLDFFSFSFFLLHFCLIRVHNKIVIIFHYEEKYFMKILIFPLQFICNPSNTRKYRNNIQPKGSGKHPYSSTQKITINSHDFQ